MADSRIDELKSLLPQCMLRDWVRLGSRLARLLHDRHHSGRHDALLNRLLDQARSSIALRAERETNRPAVTYPAELPITAKKDAIVEAIRNHQVTVIAGETGSGKTTQIPKMCLEAGLGIEAMIGCTQPRRVAALSISRRVAEELNLSWGREVGCKIRFDDRSSPQTRIKMMTDGILLAEAQGDRHLSEYNAIIIDEAHERSLNIDFLLGHLKGLLERRKDLKLIVTSATIDTETFSKHFDNAPIIEVSGRMYPVEVEYRPMDPEREERGDISYVDAAVEVAEDLLDESGSGDILIFMPGERDIRETRDQLEGTLSDRAEVIPLFGRLSSGEQQRVFSPGGRRRIVVATNIAETSLTIPGIRYVIDTGLARISRYSPRSRTRRLPVEPISQSSANQRKGRAGRVQEGVCVRLYSEEDFTARPAYTQPEIQRSNLAEVILRMKAFHLGDMETFPFVQPPAPHAIRNGYTLLQELGALDGQRELTELGNDLARLPIDPTLGRMLLQSQREHATRELLIIAAGLSIQDPRERPMDLANEADAAHKQFLDPKSDFLALLNIWNAVHDEWETLRTQNQRRKFCRKHFLSYLRMREWQDLHAQLHRALEERGHLNLNESNAAYDAIHRSILAGLIGHVALREEQNVYKAAGNRRVTVFPGSVLFLKQPRGKKKQAKTEEPPTESKASQPKWIVSGELVETSKLFARTNAGIDPEWIYRLAPHCCRKAHQNPFWNAAAGRVLVEEIVSLHGLEVQRRKVPYGPVNPGEATAIFIQSALVETDEEFVNPPDAVSRKETRQRQSRGSFRRQPAKSQTPHYRFLEHNRAVRQKIENWQTRVRRHDLGNVDQRLFDFYARHLHDVSSFHDLNRRLKEHQDPQFLFITEAELAGDQSLKYDDQAFPDAITVGGQPVPVQYAYAPGEERDGVTIRLPFSLAQAIPASVLEWAVPGLREEKVHDLLRALPKSLRRELMPFAPKVPEIVRDFQPSGDSFHRELAQFIHGRYGVEIPSGTWNDDHLRSHLKPRIQVLDNQDKTIATGRDLNALRSQLEKQRVDPGRDPAIWENVARQWEKFDLQDWTLGEVPERITVYEGEGLPLYAWPGLQCEDGQVHLRLFRSRDAAQQASLEGVRRLVEKAVHKDLAWVEKDLRALKGVEPLFAPLGDIETLQETAMENLKRFLLPEEPLPALTRDHFQSAVDHARRNIPGLAMQLIDRVEAILKVRGQVQEKIGVKEVAPRRKQSGRLTDFNQLESVLAAPETNTGPFAEELRELVPPRFLEEMPYERLPELPRYLKALLIRAERAALNPSKDRERAAAIQPFVESLIGLSRIENPSPEKRKLIGQFRWMVEEYKVSLFAQELGTAVPVSPKRLNSLLDQIRTA